MQRFWPNPHIWLNIFQTWILEQTSDVPDVLNWNTCVPQAGLAFLGSGSQAPGECWKCGHRVLGIFNPKCPMRSLSTVAVWCWAEALQCAHMCVTWNGAVCRFWSRGQVGPDTEHFSRFPGDAWWGWATDEGETARVRSSGRVTAFSPLEVKKSESEAWPWVRATSGTLQGAVWPP